MTREEIINGLKFTVEMFLLDPSTGETITEPRNDMDKITIDACRGAIKELQDNSYELWKESYEVEHERNFRLKEKINALEQESKTDVISRQDAFKVMRGLTRWYVKSEDGKYINEGLLYDDVMFGIGTLPSITSTRPKGQWEFDEKGYFSCSECKRKPKDQTATTDFCPNCGADMREGERNNNKKEIEYRVMIKEKSQRNYRLYRILNNKQDAEDLCNVLQSDNISVKINKKKDN